MNHRLIERFFLLSFLFVIALTLLSAIISTVQVVLDPFTSFPVWSGVAFAVLQFSVPLLVTGMLWFVTRFLNHNSQHAQE